jgi:hypothetical protein
MSEAPVPGFIYMLAADIVTATAYATKVYDATSAAHRAALVKHLLAWRNNLGWFSRIIYHSVPKDAKGIMAWYHDQDPWMRDQWRDAANAEAPDASYLSKQHAVSWHYRARSLPDLAQVLVNIDDAAEIRDWLAAAKATKGPTP